MQDALDRWLAAGAISPAQHTTLGALVRRDRLSVFVELNALLYLGVLALAGGVAWTARVYAAQWGDAAILLPTTALLLACAYYCARRAAPYSPQRVPSPGLAFDYVLYLACLLFAAELGYIEYRFSLLQARWDYYLLASAVLYLGVAYRFDNRFVLSLALATLAGWFGLQFSYFTFYLGALPRAAIVYGLVVGVIGLVLHRAGIKRHFLDSYLHLAVNVVLGALFIGGIDSASFSLWPMGLAVASAASVWAGVRYRHFAFVVYGVGYGYFGLSRIAIRYMPGATSGLTYVVVSAGLVVIGLIVLSHRFGKER
jgi:hypothetical protein